MTDASIQVYDPTASPRASGATLAPRLHSLCGKTVGILDNGKANAGMLMNAVTELLKRDYGVTDVLVRRKPVAGPASPQVIDEMVSQCAAVLIGSAD